ncbi:MAG: hypothetical protein AAGI11_00045 [Pseudomonadota bacterium]
MIKRILGIGCVMAALAPAPLWACAAHLTINPDELGFFGGAMVRMAGLAPPEPVFDLEHPAMVRAGIGERSELVVNYERPYFSKNVRLKVTGSRNVNLHSQELQLDDRKGTFTIPYELSGSGYDTITLTVSGEHKGEVVTEVGRVYVRANLQKSKPSMQVSGR